MYGYEVDIQTFNPFVVLQVEAGRDAEIIEIKDNAEEREDRDDGVHGGSRQRDVYGREGFDDVRRLVRGGWLMN